MNIVKKFTVIFIAILIIISGLWPICSYAENLSDAQRQALVDMAVKIIEEGNQKTRALRYSMKHREFGYKYQKVTTSDKQVVTSPEAGQLMG